MSSNLAEVNAEMLLDYLYPECNKQWIVQNMGVFYRNYNPDILDVDTNNHLVKLSRDSFLKLLPQRLIVLENELKGNNIKERFEEIQKRIRLLEDTFRPFDTFWFRRKLAAERQVSELLNHKLEFVLKYFFDFDLLGETNQYIKETAVLLPYINRLKGNMNFVRQLLASVVNCQVTLLKRTQVKDDYSACQFPSLVFQLLIPDLSAEAFDLKEQELNPYFQFVKEWFVPYDIHCEMKIKSDVCSHSLNNKLILDYNSVL